MTSPVSTTSSLPSSMPSMPSVPDPATDMPTVWVPLSASSPQSVKSTGRNILAPISLFISLIFPVGVLVNLSAAFAQANHLPQAVMMMLVMIGGSLTTIGLAGIIAAIASGHVALVLAKQYTRANALRWMAIVGLAVGYLSLVSFLAVMALFIAAGLNGF